ncbi:hypothetical protein [Yinghuangia seranimata]|uniref:hypothetical protein n=1 Tax=Yinghuangia seranimata TaxID=408067 RepID=UPI00248AE302|nr:hypothetical protein [Yinghuangia seranimata]MDI2125757.1 hypothetical protein [Yinghuangia seranimata]
MNHQTNPQTEEFAELAELLPVPAERDIPVGRGELMKSTLYRTFDEAARGGGKTPVSRRRRLMWRIGMPVAVLAAAGGTVAAVLIDDSPTQPEIPTAAYCNSTFAKAPEKVLYGVPLGPGQTPEAACAAAWDTLVSMQGGPAVAPELMTCVAKDILWVVPKPADRTVKDACASLGLTLPDYEALYHGATMDQVRRISTLLDSREASPYRCLTADQARAIAEHALAEVGITTWRVEEGFETTRTRGVFPVAVPGDGVIYLRNASGADCP